VAANGRRDEAHVYYIIVLGRRDPPNGRDNLGEAAADQLVRSLAGASHFPGVCSSNHLLIISFLALCSSQLGTPLIQLVDELNNSLFHTSV
jgi:hypothetical protein